MLTFIFLGPPGIGKGTMAEALCREAGWLQLSTGQALREEIGKKSELGRQVENYVKKGEYVPDEVVVQIVAAYLEAHMHSAEAVILDGFPRTLAQAESLEAVLRKLKLELTAAILLEASEDVIVARLTGRRICRDCGAIFHLLFVPPKTAGRCDGCGGELYQRADDHEDTVRKRLKVYQEQTAPLVAHYESRTDRAQNKLQRVDASGERESNIVRLTEVISAYK